MANSRMAIALISSHNNASLASSPLDRSCNLRFQGKPAVERDSSDSAGRRDRPQAVTKHLFAPTVQQQQQQQQQQEQPQLSCRPPPQTATASIFAPRTEDMNKGFLTFSEDQPGLTSAYFSSEQTLFPNKGQKGGSNILATITDLFGMVFVFRFMDIRG